jgi:hypothetical protein
MPVGDTRGGGDRRGRPRGRAALTLRAWRKAPGRRYRVSIRAVFPFLPPWKSIGRSAANLIKPASGLEQRVG